MYIAHADLEIQREPFARPFGFKGSAFHEKWNLVVRLRDDSGNEAFGLGGLAVLWSDADVFSAHTEVGGNLLQASLLEFALQEVVDREFASPVDILPSILPDVHEYGKTVTRQPDLRLTFSLISLVALDNAAWMLYCKANAIDSFDAMIPERYRPYLSERQPHVAFVPTVSYTLPMEELRAVLDDGAYILKVKIGHPGSEEEMASKDMAWLSQIHGLAAGYETSMTESGSVLYYLDANGRYTEKDSMERLLAYTAEIGMHERIVIVEEPFDETLEVDVSSLPARFAADESIHSVQDVKSRIEQGYGAMAIKPAGKTLSLAFQMIQAAADAGVPCFVADNGCVPILVEWNKGVAARLPDFPGVKGNMVESHGTKTYGSWADMLAAYPIPDATWLTPRSGAFVLDEEYYDQSGGLFLDPAPYSDLFR